MVPAGYAGNYHYANMAHGGGHLYEAVATKARQLEVKLIAAKLIKLMDKLHERALADASAETTTAETAVASSPDDTTNEAEQVGEEEEEQGP